VKNARRWHGKAVTDEALRRSLNPNTRQEFIWEHFGMMDDPVYCENAMKKLSTYQENGILPGRKLIATYESGRFPLNKRLIEKTIREYFQ